MKTFSENFDASCVQILIKVFFSWILVFSTTGCLNRELSREHAAEKILASAAISEVRDALVLSREGFQRGIKLGWWVTNPFYDTFQPEASQAGLNEEFLSFGGGGGGEKNLKTTKPQEIDINITGISKNTPENFSLAEFSWSYKNLSPAKALVAAKGGTGIAAFQKYDDGWRLIRMDRFYVSDEVYPATEKDIQAANIFAASIQIKKTAASDELKREQRKRIANASESIIGIWTFDNGYTKLQFNTDKTFNRYVKRGSLYIVYESGNWKIHEEYLILHRTMKELFDAKLHPDNTSTTFQIIDITSTQYVVSNETGQKWTSKKI